MTTAKLLTVGTALAVLAVLAPAGSRTVVHTPDRCGPASCVPDAAPDR